MAYAIQTVRRSNRTVPQHHKPFRVRESRPIVVHLPVAGLNHLYETISYLHELAVFTVAAAYGLEQLDFLILLQLKPIPPGIHCKLIYCVNFIVKILRKHTFPLLLFWLILLALHCAAPYMSQVWYLQKFHGVMSPSCSRCALSVETFALNACVNNLTSVMWSGLSESQQWRLFISCSFLLLHAWL